MILTTAIEKQIHQLYRGRNHMELTIGIRMNGENQILHLGPDGKPKQEHLRYPVGSIGKTFTVSLLSKYSAEGKLRWSDPLSRYIPDLPEQSYPSLRRLATHSAGYGGLPFRTAETVKVLAGMNRKDGFFHKNPHHGRLDEQEIRELLAKHPRRDRDYRYQYSNFGFAVLGQVIANLSGQCCWDAMNDYMQNDLGLKNTYFGTTDLIGYDKKDQPCEAWTWDRQDGAAPAGALISTAEDLLEYARMQMDGSRPYMVLCHQKHGDGEKDFVSGLAWRIQIDRDEIWHGGSAGAYSGYLGFDPNREVAVVTACNYGLADAEGLGHTILEAL